LFYLYRLLNFEYFTSKLESQPLTSILTVLGGYFSTILRLSVNICWFLAKFQNVCTNYYALFFNFYTCTILLDKICIVLILDSLQVESKYIVVLPGFALDS